MATIKSLYGTSTSITITLASLASGSSRESAAVDNTTNLFLDALVYLAIPLATGTPAGDKAIYVYAAGSEDGTNYGDNATGSDAAITLRSPTNLRLIGVINTPDSGAVTYKSHPISVAAAFGGFLPRKWSIIVQNATGLALGTTGFTSTYTGIQTQSV